MSTITIAMSDDRLQRLKEKATKLKVAPEELARVGVEDLLARPEDEFQRALDRVIDKNAELYRRLA